MRTSNIEHRTLNIECGEHSAFDVRCSMFDVPFFLISSLLLICSPLIATAAEPTKSELDFFESKIRPLLTDRCYKCHSSKSEKLKGGLSLEFRDTILKGGKTGPAIVPGDPEKSLLITAVRYTDP